MCVAVRGLDQSKFLFAPVVQALPLPLPPKKVPLRPLNPLSPLNPPVNPAPPPNPPHNRTPPLPKETPPEVLLQDQIVH